MLRPASRIIEVPYLVYVRHSVWLTARLCGSSAACLQCVDYFADAIRQFYRPGELTALLEAIGFDNVENRNFLTGVMAYHIARKPPV
jgi:ubiquinone/menaquinone biosynthesis C-methylase UbiE